MEDYLEISGYSLMKAFVVDKNGESWREAYVHYGRPGRKVYDEVKQSREGSVFVPYKNYKNKNKYKIISEYWNIVEDTKELIVGYDTNKIDGYKEDDFSGFISYANMSRFDEKDCFLTVSSGNFWYELDHTNGKIKPAYGQITYR